MKGLGNAAATVVVVDEGRAAQRVDNFLLRELKGVPRSHVYRVLRSGEVRVNSGRVDAPTGCRPATGSGFPRSAGAPRRRAGRRAARSGFRWSSRTTRSWSIDKPSGVAVHGGSGVSFGVIESLRAARPEAGSSSSPTGSTARPRAC